MMEGEYKQQATYWAPSSMDGFGNRTFSSPVLINVRWEDRTDLNIGTTQEFKPSKAKVFLQQIALLGGYLALGDYTATANPTSLPNAHMIQQYAEIPALTGLDMLRKVVL